MAGQKGPLGLGIQTEKKAVQAANRTLLKRQQGKCQVLNSICVSIISKTGSIIPVPSSTFSLMVAIFFLPNMQFFPTLWGGSLII